MPNNRILFALGAVVLAHFCWLAYYVVPAYASPDADGYFGEAELMVHKGRLTFEAESPAQFIGIHWLEKTDGTFISRYPPGLPLLLAGTWKLFGRAATFYLNPLLAS